MSRRFAAHADVAVQKYTLERYSVDAWVDETSARGVHRRNYFFCVVQGVGANWQLVHLELQ